MRCWDYYAQAESEGEVGEPLAAHCASLSSGSNSWWDVGCESECLQRGGNASTSVGSSCWLAYQRLGMAATGTRNCTSLPEITVRATNNGAVGSIEHEDGGQGRNQEIRKKQRAGIQ